MDKTTIDKLMATFNQLSLGEKLVFVGGVVMLVASFFHWFTISIAGLSSSGATSGWGNPGSIWSTLAILISIFLAAIIVLERFANMTLPALPENVTWGKVFGIGAALVVVLMLLKAWRISAFSCGPLLNATCSGGFGFGFFIGVLATIAVAAGGYMLYSAEKAGLPHA